MSKCRNVEMGNGEINARPCDLIQRCWLFEHMIEGLSLIFMINYLVMIQLAEPNHGSWTVGDSVAEAFFPEKIGGVIKEKNDKRYTL
jgi:hypothetical protein